MRASKWMLVCALCSFGVWAQVPTRIMYQGTLLEADGTTPVSGTVALKFGLYSTETGGTALATQDEPSVAMQSGYFTVNLASLFTTDRSGELFLEVSVRGASDTNYDVLPRAAIGSVPYALRAKVADRIDWANVTNAPAPVPGPQGPAGAMGAIGPAGPQGEQGAIGPQGIQGLTGEAGPTGPQGATGPAGTTGANGVSVVAASEGPGTNCATGGTRFDVGGLISYVCNGATGPAGPTGLTGATGPQGPIGLTGSTGLQGPIGLTGATGPQGPIGLTGSTGLQGPIGLTGATGLQGPIGLTGATGLQGPIGLTGATGPQGPIGLTGSTGPQGPAGPGSVVSVAAGTGLNGGIITTVGTISLANTSVTPASYARANVTVDAQGRLTAASNGAAINLASEVTGSLPDTNLATLSTAGKVANSATTATSSNSANALVSRDGSGSFSAGTITASFSGNGAALTSLNGSNVASGTVPVARLPTMVGDTGAGGTAGLAPAPGAGDASAGKFLKADGTWAAPASGSGPSLAVKITSNYTVGANDKYIIVKATGLTITLPSAAANANRMLVILTNNNGFTLAGGNIRDGNNGNYNTSTATAVYGAFNWWPIMCVSDGADWYLN